MADVKFVTKQDILTSISILDICEEEGIELEQISSGNFDYRCKCPSKDHKSGNERTGSCYINSEGNNFYCFGCSASSNLIDFYMLVKDIEFIDAFRELKPRATPSGKKKTFYKKPSNFAIQVEISSLLRETMVKNPKDLKWLNGIMIQVDKYLEDIDTKDVRRTKILLKSLQKTISERYSR